MKPSRKEDFRLVTGHGRFTADWTFPNEAQAVVVRSDRGHARIVSADWSAVREAPGVLAVLTAEDIEAEGFKMIPGGAMIAGSGGQQIKMNQMPVLATDRVRFVGQPVALVVAETLQQARDAAEQAYIEYEDLPAVASADAALLDGAGQLHDSAPGNV
ncbi:MAG: xanthine dehydrogenase family protein molybdopterin-binding subunit, partial [Quisquiliibacterium sp.]